MSQSPLPLEYQKPKEPQPGRPRWGLFTAGVVAGWILLAFAFAAPPSRFIMRYVYWLVPIQQQWMMVFIHLITGVTLCFFKRWRPFGIGLIVSVPLAGLIIFGALAIVCGGFKGI